MATIGNTQDGPDSTTPFGWQRFVSQGAGTPRRRRLRPRRSLLERGFTYEGHRVPLLGPQGIFKPRVTTSIPLSITTVPVVEGEARPYDDAFGQDGLLRYRYRGNGPFASRECGFAPGYGTTGATHLLPRHRAWPLCARVAHFHRRRRSNAADVHGERGRTLIHQPRQRGGRDRGIDDTTAIRDAALPTAPSSDSIPRTGRPSYLHHCAVCRLKRKELIEAAHILPDADPLGEPAVPNGVALCRLHHAAFDKYLIGIRPDCVVEVRQDVLDDHRRPHAGPRSPGVSRLNAARAESGLMRGPTRCYCKSDMNSFERQSR